MRMIAKCALFLSLTAMAFAASYTGKLVDANCADRGGKAPAAQPGQPGGGGAGQSTEACMPTQSTSSFALQTTDGKILKLDAAGNTKASAVARTDAGKSVTVMGEVQGDTLKVDNISAGDSQKGGAPSPSTQPGAQPGQPTQQK